MPNLNLNYKIIVQGVTNKDVIYSESSFFVK